MPLTLLTLWLTICPTIAKGQSRTIVTVTDVDLGEMRVGENAFRATLQNTSSEPVFAVLDLRAVPGMWFGGNHQHQVGIDLDVGEIRNVETTYTLIRMSPEASLRVRVGPGVRSETGMPTMTEVSGEHGYAIGEGNPDAFDIESAFDIVQKGLLEVYAVKNSYASDRIEYLAEARLAAIDAIGAILAVDPPDRIRLVFYPDADTKTAQTGHRGEGWAFGNTIVEIYNESVQLDPYHEVAHILASGFGSLPSAFDEGLATYISERLGADALQYLGAPGESVTTVSCRALADETAFPLTELVMLDVGTPESRPPVSYPQAASLAKFVLERYGAAAFSDLYAALGHQENSSAGDVDSAVQTTLGLSLSVLETEWKGTVLAACR